MKHLYRLAAIAVLLPSITQLASGHSWVDELNLIAPNGTFVGEPGYPRGNYPRTALGFEDKHMQYLLPPNTRAGNKILPTDNICKETQRQQKQTQGSPRLKAAPGSRIAIRYQENGHVTIPEVPVGKPDNRGTVYIYATTDSRPNDSFLSIHGVWTADGTGGDGRGMLLQKGNYDDGRCYQANDKPISVERQAKFRHEIDPLMGPNLWCQQNIALPVNIPVGKPYTLYWVWDWPTAAGVDPGLPNGKTEIYTTCIDVDIVPASEIEPLMMASADKYVADQDLNRAAIPDQFRSLNLKLEIPGATGNAPSPTTLVTSTISSATQTATATEPSQSLDKVVAPTATGMSCAYKGRPTSSTQKPLFTAPSAGVFGTPTAKLDYRAPRVVSEGGATYEEYKRLDSDDNDHESAEEPAPAFHVPRLPPQHRGRRHIFW